MMRKTERTHEENQERAYIAASRRTDRSLEARMESARRASEIHKRRTGKALKITEQDVVNEEMYEEEDDDLPPAYRNLNTHLQTGSSGFDARLQAYLANAVAFRKALSGVVKQGDKSQQADFVNFKQYADHESLFPKHSDNWKDVLQKKQFQQQSPITTSQQSMLNTKTGAAPAGKADASVGTPYRLSDSSLHRRRLSSTAGIDTMGTLKPQDLARSVPKFKPAPRHPSLPRPLEHPAPLPLSPVVAPETSISDPLVGVAATAGQSFSALLPQNTRQILMPWNNDIGTSSAFDDPDTAALLDDTLMGSHGIDATLAPAAYTIDGGKAALYAAAQPSPATAAAATASKWAVDIGLDSSIDQAPMQKLGYGSQLRKTDSMASAGGHDIDASLWDFIDSDGQA